MSNQEPNVNDALVFFDKCNFINAEMDHDLNSSGPIYSAFQYPSTNVDDNFLSSNLKSKQSLFLKSNPKNLNQFKDPQINDFKKKSRENVKGYCYNSFDPDKININFFPSIEEYIKNPMQYKNNLYEFFKDEGNPDFSANMNKATHISKLQMANQPGTLVSRIFPGLYPKTYWSEYIGNTSSNGFIVAPFCKNGNPTIQSYNNISECVYLNEYSTYPSGLKKTQEAIRKNIFDVLKKFKWGEKAEDFMKNSTPVITKIDGDVEGMPGKNNDMTGISRINRINLYLFHMYNINPGDTSSQNDKKKWMWDVSKLFDYETIGSKSIIGNGNSNSYESDEGDVNVFLFVDTINLYNKFPDLTKDINKAQYIQNKNYNYNIHIIHTVFSLADTASKTGPFHNNKYNPPAGLNNKVRFFSWLYYPKNDNDKFRTTEVPSSNGQIYDNFDANKILDVGYSVRTSLKTGISLNKKSTFSDIIQLWSPHDNNPPFIGLASDNKINEPRKNSNAPKIRNKIGSIYTNWSNINKPNAEKPPFNEIPNTDKEKIFLLAQQKKYGDYGQLYSASRFPGTVAASTFDFDSIKLICGGPPNSSELTDKEKKFNSYLPNNPNSKINEWIRDRTFLVTGDWPCFCYTVYNKVNCLFHPPSGKSGLEGFKTEIGIRAVF